MGADQDRTEQATPKRRERARVEGDHARSPLASYAAVAWAACAASALVPTAAGSWIQAFSRCATDAARAAQAMDATADVAAASDLGRSTFLWLAIGSVWVAAVAASIASSAACGAIGWSAGALRWRVARASPAAGLRSMFGREAMVQTAMSACAAAALLACALPAAKLDIGANVAAHGSREQAALAGAIVSGFWWRSTLALSLLAAIDVALARRRYAFRLRMTPREVRDERAEQEGKPETKARRRSIAMRRSRRLRVTSVKRAAAVLTNPTHVAVALAYEPPEIDVPIVVAAGADGAALILRTAAALYDVPVVESPDLARLLFSRVDVDEPIPEELYAGIAAVFAWILKTRGFLGSSARPT